MIFMFICRIVAEVTAQGIPVVKMSDDNIYQEIANSSSREPSILVTNVDEFVTIQLAIPDLRFTVRWVRVFVTFQLEILDLRLTLRSVHDSSASLQYSNYVSR